MAFPADYTKYQEVTIDSSKIDSDLTDFIIYVKLADLVKAGADIFDTCTSSGGDIRVTKSDGTTELPREVVEIDTVAKTGWLMVKFSGTLSSSSDTTIRIWYNGTDTEPAASSTYGSENVYTDFARVWHGVDGTESSGNGSVSSGGALTYGGATGQLGSATSFDGVNDYVRLSSVATEIDTADWTFDAWGYLDAGQSAYDMFFHSQFQSGRAQPIHWRTDNGVASIYKDGIYSGSSWTGLGSNISISYGTWFHFAMKRSGGTAEVIFNGVSLGTFSSPTNYDLPSGGSWINLGAHSNGVHYLTGREQGVGFHTVARSDDWIIAKYKNQSSPATFYSVGDEVGGGSSQNSNLLSYL